MDTFTSVMFAKQRSRGVARVDCARLSLFAAFVVVAVPLDARAATLIGPYPFAVGDSFTYAFRSTDTITNSSGTTTSTQSYTQTTTIQQPIQYPYPPSHSTVAAYPFDTRATSTTSAGTLTIHDIEYRNFVAGAGGTRTYVIYGSTNTSDLIRPDKVTQHLSETDVFGSPGILDKLPEAKGATWHQPINNTVTTNDNYQNTGSADSNILQSKYQGALDGSYTDSGKRFDVPYSVAEKADGTGTLSEGPPTAIEQWQFELPTTGTNGKVIPVIVTFQGKTGKNSVPDWFPGHAAAPKPLTVSTAVDEGVTLVPTGCGTYAGKSAVRLHQTYSQLGVPGTGKSDFYGYTVQETEDFYVMPGIGRVCVAESRVATLYNSKVSGAVVSKDTYASTLGLIKETIH